MGRKGQVCLRSISICCNRQLGRGYQLPTSAQGEDPTAKHRWAWRCLGALCKVRPVRKAPPSAHCAGLKLPDCAIRCQRRGFGRNGDGTLSAEEAEFAKETTDRGNEETRLGEARLPTGEALREDERGGAPTAPLETSDALHEIEEVYQVIEDVSYSLSEQLV
jgi:hypothetical protein